MAAHWISTRASSIACGRLYIGLAQGGAGMGIKITLRPSRVLPRQPVTARWRKEHFERVVR